MMAIPRPIKADLDTWASQGNPEWAWEKVLPVLRRMESDQDFPDSPIHGNSGPIQVRRRHLFDIKLGEQEQALLEALDKLGVPRFVDLNVPNPYGVAPVARNIKDGKRLSATVAYLNPARHRSNLTVIGEAQVGSLLLRGKAAMGVRYRKEGRDDSATADKVVLSAGVYHSPQILMLSGIGPSAELKRLDISVVQDMPGIGENYQDHPMVTMTFKANLANQKPLMRARSTVKIYFKTDPAREYLNFHIIPREAIELSGIGDMLGFSCNLLEQTNRGKVTLRSADPADLPDIDPQVLEHPKDIAAMLSAMRFVQRLAGTDPLSQFFGELFSPGANEDWEKFARSSYTSYYHGVGTCKMGPASDSMAVVDQRLRVHGIDNLWVGDASIMPTVAHANTNLTVMMIAERTAGFIQGLS
jgi:choline dehydrogenase